MKQSAPNWIAEALKIEQGVLVEKLKLAKKSIGHAPTKGGVAENIWLEFLRRYLPNRYEVSSGFAVDSKGGISDQIDIIIYDNHFTPLLLSQENHRYIPAEAVYMVFEVKPEFSPDSLPYTGEKLSSVRCLHRTSDDMVSSGKLVEKRDLFQISGGLLAFEGWKFFERKVREYRPSDESRKINCGCCLSKGAFDDYNGGGKCFHLSSDTSLPYFMIRLLGHLNSLGSAPKIDWNAYSEILSNPQRFITSF